jgi:hypothetical protein
VNRTTPTATERQAAFSRARDFILDEGLSRAAAESIRQDLHEKGLCEDYLWDRLLSSIDRRQGAAAEAARILGNHETPTVPPTLGLQPISASKILEKEYPPLRFIVPGLVVEGLTLLAGRPKIGKSWFALDLAVATARGGAFLGRQVTERADVLYLALEDSESRIKGRLSIVGRGSCPGALDFLFEIPRLDNGGAEKLHEWLESHPSVKLVIVDVLHRIRGPRPAKTDPYQHDAMEVSKLQRLAAARGVSMIVVHHDRKADAGDWLDKVSGTLGVTGSADTVALLERDRGSSNGRLRVTGRDLEEESDLGLEFHNGLWHFIGPGETLELTHERRKILDASRRYGTMSPSGIAKATDLSINTVKPALRAMEAAGLVRREGTGRYVAVDTSHTPHTPDLFDGVSRV